MITPFTLALALLPLFGAAYLEDPPTTAAPDTVADCSYWHVAEDNDSCASISDYWGFTETQFATYNPSLANGCELVVGNSYCVERNWGLPVSSPTATTSSFVTSTTQTPASTPTTALEICEAEAGGYKRYCPRCLSRCANQSANMDQCFYSVFMTISYYDSQCWQHGGNDCANKAADSACP